MAMKKKHEADEDLSTEDLAERAEREDIAKPKVSKAAPVEKLHDLIAPYQTGAVGVSLDDGECLTVRPDASNRVTVPERFVVKLLEHGFRREQK
jgi:hypothetical protein